MSLNKAEIITAKTLSYILSLGWIPVLFFAVIFKTNLNFNQIKILLPSLLIFTVVIPAVFWAFFVQEFNIKSWDLDKREERYKVIGVLVVSWIISLVLVYFFGNRLIFDLLLMSVLVAIIDYVINFFYKVSLHASLTTSAVLLLNYFFSFNLPFLYILIPLVFWSRLKLKKHTIGQLLLGSFISLFIFLIFLKVLN